LASQERSAVSRLSDLVADAPDIPTIEIPDLSGDGKAPVRDTFERMAETFVTGKPAPEKPKPDVTSAFDKGRDAKLVFQDAPVYPKNPVPTGTRRSPKATPASRPAGAADLQGLFATGLILVLVFAVGDWATPTAEEADAIAQPLANIVARRIDLATKLGKDASDTIALAIAIMSYGARVGPVAAERIRENIDARRRRERVDSVGAPPRPLHDRGEGGVAVGSADGANTAPGASYDPFNALAQAQRNGLGVLERDLTGGDGLNPALGFDG
jgi:hypothetical protein